MAKLLFESETCGRCGGSGSYSYCQMHGSTCFKCNGKGEQLTKRGKAAQAWFSKQRETTADQIKVGDLMRFNDLHSTFTARVTSVEPTRLKGVSRKIINGKFEMVPYDNPGISIMCEKSGLTCAPDCVVQRGYTKAERRKVIQAALEYQKTLTKAGTVRKRQAKSTTKAR